jgi:hypothetical protein
MHFPCGRVTRIKAQRHNFSKEPKNERIIDGDLAGCYKRWKPRISMSRIADRQFDREELISHAKGRPDFSGITSTPPPPEVPIKDFPFTSKLGLFYDLDFGAFKDAIDTDLTGNVAGYVASLRQDGSTIFTLSWSDAIRTPEVQPPLVARKPEAWTPNIRMHVASCSKLITAIAITKVLDESATPYDKSIISYLPGYWQKGPHIGDITFRHLLTHTSGFNTGTSKSDFVTMKKQVENGVAFNPTLLAPRFSGIGSFHYENMNFGLCRILLAVLVGDIHPSDTHVDVDNWWDLVTANSYVQYVNDHIFTQAGIAPGPTLDHHSSDALAYPFPVGGPGWNSGDFDSAPGADGWHFSVNELLDVMGTFRRGGTIMAPTRAQNMLDQGFGIELIYSGSSILGNYYGRTGYWLERATQRVEQSAAIFLPGNMELAVLANSSRGPDVDAGNMTKSLIYAFTESIKPRQIFKVPSGP